MKKNIKIILILMVTLLILASLPAVFANNKNFNLAKNNAEVILDEASKICSSSCAEYPVGWVVEGKEIEAELYCIAQCSNNMEKIRKEVVSNIKPTIFNSKYSYVVEQGYCLLGLRCLSLEIEDFIYGYKHLIN